MKWLFSLLESQFDFVLTEEAEGTGLYFSARSKSKQGRRAALLRHHAFALICALIIMEDQPNWATREGLRNLFCHPAAASVVDEAYLILERRETASVPGQRKQISCSMQMQIINDAVYQFMCVSFSFPKADARAFLYRLHPLRPGRSEVTAA